MQEEQEQEQENFNSDIKAGSIIDDPEEKEMRKYDDWKSHRHEKERDLQAEYRATELHGVVGKEIHDALKTSSEGGSSLEQEDLKFKKYDDWKAHKAEKNRDLNAEYRETDLHGYVGKEIKDLLELDRKNSAEGKKRTKPIAKSTQEKGMEIKIEEKVESNVEQKGESNVEQKGESNVEQKGESNVEQKGESNVEQKGEEKQPEKLEEKPKDTS